MRAPTDSEQSTICRKASTNIFAYGNPCADVLDAPCPKCGEPLVCCYCDMGATDYYDNFWHVCLGSACDYAEHTEQYCGLGQEGTDDRTCPFCGNDHSKHP